ncbi:MAG: hypothetical protein OXT07_10520 [bacterium]|nr:hypothetical protein [bacterium]MDE0117040.1 hypothetical protein [bacterium]
MSAARPPNVASRAAADRLLVSTRLDPRYRSTRYPVTAAPPSSAGGDHTTPMLSTSTTAPTTPGAPGRRGAGRSVRALAVASGPRPALFWADTRA